VAVLVVVPDTNGRHPHRAAFETFPFPRSSLPALVEQIRPGETALNDYRNEVMVARETGAITDLYKRAYFNETPPASFAKLHQALDALC